MSVKVDEKTGIWEGLFVDNDHFYDSKLSLGLQNFFLIERARSIMDLGCGTGDYVNALRKVGILCDGCDGNSYTPMLGGPHCKVVDLTQENLVLRNEEEKRYDWVLSLEVGEHLPKQYEQSFLDLMVNTSSKGVVLSWATVGQGGLGHVNERSNSYIEKEMKKRDGVRDLQAEKVLRQQSSPQCSWFESTIMVYRFA